VREGLLRLTAEGLLTRTSFHGVQVKKLTLDDVRDMFLTRRVIELSGVDAAHGASWSDLEALRTSVDAFTSAMRRGETNEQNEADLNVHRAIVRLLRSPRLTQVHSGLMSELRVALAAAYRGEDAVPEEDLIDRHSEFLRMISANDIGTARTQLEERLNLAEERLVAGLGASFTH
jgi:DNA-binding GntR family transcriptional regulator